MDQLPVPLSPQHNQAKPVNEMLLRHEPHVCDGICSRYTVDLDVIISQLQTILVVLQFILLDWVEVRAGAGTVDTSSCRNRMGLPKNVDTELEEHILKYYHML